MTKGSDLEKRVAKLEKEIAILMKNHKTSGKNKTYKKGKHSSAKTKKKRKVNEFFKMMIVAKKAGKPSFVYKGNTYKGTKHPRLGMVYKKA